MIGWLAVTFLLGAGFIGMEVYEFAKLIHEGAGPDRSAFLSAYFALVEIQRGLAGNLCRCGAYAGILRAAQQARGPPRRPVGRRLIVSVRRRRLSLPGRRRAATRSDGRRRSLAPRRRMIIFSE